MMKKKNTPRFEKCIVHKWGKETIEEMSVVFRVCERCGALEGKTIFRNGMKDCWHKWVPTGGKEFIEALRQKILHDKLKAEAEANKGEIDTEVVDVEAIE